MVKRNPINQIDRWRRGWVALSVLVPALTGGCGPMWYIDPGFAQRLAKQKGRPLLFYFKAWDSTQHRNMKLELLEYPAIKRELLETVNVELEFAWATDYARRYGVQRPQVCVMCSPDGEKVFTSLYVNPVPSEEEFLQWLRRAIAEAVPPPTSAPTTKPAETGTGAKAGDGRPRVPRPAGRRNVGRPPT